MSDEFQEMVYFQPLNISINGRKGEKFDKILCGIAGIEAMFGLFLRFGFGGVG